MPCPSSLALLLFSGLLLTKRKPMADALFPSSPHLSLELHILNSCRPCGPVPFLPAPPTQPSRIPVALTPSPPLNSPPREMAGNPNAAATAHDGGRPPLPDWAVALSLVLVGFGVYANTLHAGFTFDDNFAVIGNKDVTDASRSPFDLFLHDFWGQSITSDMSHKSYRPLTVFSFRTIHGIGQSFAQARMQVAQEHAGLAAGGPQATAAAGSPADAGKPRQTPDPFFFHLANASLHALVSYLVYCLAYRLAVVRVGLKADGNIHEEAWKLRNAWQPLGLQEWQHQFEQTGLSGAGHLGNSDVSGSKAFKQQVSSLGGRGFWRVWNSIGQSWIPTGGMEGAGCAGVWQAGKQRWSSVASGSKDN